MISLSGCAGTHPRMRYGVPIDARPGLTCSTCFYQEGERVDADSVKSTLGKSPDYGDTVSTARTLEGATRIFQALGTAALIFSGPQYVEEESTRRNLLIGAAVGYGLSIGFWIGSHQAYRSAVEQYNAGLSNSDDDYALGARPDFVGVPATEAIVPSLLRAPGEPCQAAPVSAHAVASGAFITAGSSK